MTEPRVQGDAQRHDLVLARLAQRATARDRIADWDRTWGDQVRVPPTRVRPAAADRRAAADPGDLFVSEEGVTWRRIELTGRTRECVDAATGPYRDGLLVCSWYRGDAAVRTGQIPWRAIVTNRALTPAAVLVDPEPSWRAGRWRTRTTTDPAQAHTTARAVAPAARWTACALDGPEGPP